MENENENFDQLTKLLSLKKHEVPPPGYFNKLPGEVIARIRVGQAQSHDPITSLRSEAPWLLRLWQALESKPAFAGVFGAAVCAVVLAAIVFAEKPANQPIFAGPSSPSIAPFVAANPATASGLLDQPMLVASTNQTGVNLFDQIPNLPTVPASATP